MSHRAIGKIINFFNGPNNIEPFVQKDVFGKSSLPTSCPSSHCQKMFGNASSHCQNNKFWQPFQPLSKRFFGNRVAFKTSGRSRHLVGTSSSVTKQVMLFYTSLLRYYSAAYSKKIFWLFITPMHMPVGRSRGLYPSLIKFQIKKLLVFGVCLGLKVYFLPRQCVPNGHMHIVVCWVSFFTQREDNCIYYHIL